MLVFCSCDGWVICFTKNSCSAIRWPRHQSVLPMCHGSCEWEAFRSDAFVDCWDLIPWLCVEYLIRQISKHVSVHAWDFGLFGWLDGQPWVLGWLWLAFSPLIRLSSFRSFSFVNLEKQDIRLPLELLLLLRWENFELRRKLILRDLVWEQLVQRWGIECTAHSKSCWPTMSAPVLANRLSSTVFLSLFSTDLLFVSF